MHRGIRGDLSKEGQKCTGDPPENIKNFYVKLIYDNRIQLQCVSFDREDERDIVYLSDQLQLTYCDFRKKESYAWATQEFSREDGTWGERTERTKDNKVTATCGTTIYTKLAIRLKFWMDKEGEDAVVENWNAVTLYQKLDGQSVGARRGRLQAGSGRVPCGFYASSADIYGMLTEQFKRSS